MWLAAKAESFRGCRTLRRFFTIAQLLAEFRLGQLTLNGEAKSLIIGLTPTKV